MSRFRLLIFAHFALAIGIISVNTAAQTYFSVETAAAWQARNDQRVPGEGGNLFSVADFDKGPFFSHRVYAGHRWGTNHELRLLYAPLSIEANGEFDNSIRYQDSTFAPQTPTRIDYKFNSYRLSYIYHFVAKGDWQWAFGFTGKVRDAEVRVRQGPIDESKANVGFVPLAHLQATWNFSPEWSIGFDLDGLAAPQGRAIDLGVFLRRSWQSAGSTVFAGYRTVEGGADNDEVYNFAWFHFATFGFAYQL